MRHVPVMVIVRVLITVWVGLTVCARGVRIAYAGSRARLQLRVT